VDPIFLTDNVFVTQLSIQNQQMHK